MGRSTQWWVYSMGWHLNWITDTSIDNEMNIYPKSPGTTAQPWETCRKDDVIKPPCERKDTLLRFFSPDRHVTRQAIKWWEALLRIKLSVPISPWALVLISSGRQGIAPSTLTHFTKNTLRPPLIHWEGGSMAVSPIQLCTIPCLLSHRRWNHSFAGVIEVLFPLWRVPIPSDMPSTSRPHPHSTHTSIQEGAGVHSNSGEGSGKKMKGREEHRWIRIKVTRNSLNTSCLYRLLQRLGFTLFLSRPITTWTLILSSRGNLISWLLN